MESFSKGQYVIETASTFETRLFLAHDTIASPY